MLLAPDNPRPFWTRSTLWYGVAGLAAYLGSHWLFKINSLVVITVVTVARLLLGIAPAALLAHAWGWRFRGSWAFLAVAVPYPIDWAVLVYSRRFEWLPRSLLLQLSGPAAFLIFIAALLLASQYLTAWAVGRSLAGRPADHLRRLGTLLFLLTAAGVVLAPPELSAWFLKYVADPIALTGYGAILGHAQMELDVTSSAA